MSSQSSSVVEAKRTIVAHPDETPERVEIDLGGTLVFVNEYKGFDYFEIAFQGPPPSIGDTLTGTKEIHVHMPYEESSFPYQIVYRKKDGTRVPDQKSKVARTCPGCPKK